MTWKEFQLRIDGYNRIQKTEWEKYRLVAYQVYASTPMKNKPVSIDRYLPLGDQKIDFTDSMKEAIKDQYNKLKSKIKWQQTS